MKKDDIKGRLNSISTDWDKEGVWAKIGVSEKKKRRLPFFWWVFGIVAIGALIVVPFYNLDSTSISSEYSEVVDSRAIIQLNYQDNIDTKIKGGRSSSGSLNLVDIGQRIDKTPVNKVDHTITVINSVIENTNIESESIERVESIRIEPSSKSVEGDFKRASNSEALQSLKSIETISYNDLVNSIKPKKAFSSNQEVTNDKEGRSRAYLNISQLLNLNREGVVFQLDKSDMFNWPDEFVKLRRTKRSQPKHAIQFGIGSTFGNHQFVKDDIYDRDMLEKNRLGLSSLVKYSRLFSNSWRASAGLSLHIHKTSLNRSILRENQYVMLDIDDNIYVTTSELTFDLYNYYGFLDADLELGYKWSLGQMIILPKGGVGFNLISWAQGDVIDEEGNLINLNEVYPTNESEKIYYFWGLEIGVKLGNNYSLGLESTIQSKREVFSSEGIHHISPVSFNLIFLLKL